MTNCYTAAILITLGVFGARAESNSHTYTGNIVNARCMQAATIVSRNSRGYTPTGATAFAGTAHKPIDTAGMRKTILRHCSINAGVTQFALIDSKGNFLVLDEQGNTQIALKGLPLTRETAVTIKGFVDHATLNVQSISVRQ